MPRPHYRCSTFPSPVKTPARKMYVNGGGLLVESINSSHLLLFYYQTLHVLFRYQHLHSWQTVMTRQLSILTIDTTRQSLSYRPIRTFVYNNNQSTLDRADAAQSGNRSEKPVAMHRTPSFTTTLRKIYKPLAIAVNCKGGLELVKRTKSYFSTKLEYFNNLPYIISPPVVFLHCRKRAGPVARP